jgi:hypothetical protein
LPSGLKQLGFDVKGELKRWWLRSLLFTADVDEMAKSAFQQKRLIENAPMSVDIAKIADIYRHSLAHW